MYVVRFYCKRRWRGDPGVWKITQPPVESKEEAQRVKDELRKIGIRRSKIVKV